MAEIETYIPEEDEEIKLGSFPVAEQETHIHWMRTDSYAEVYTTDKTTMTKLDRLCEESPENYKLQEVGTLKGVAVSKTYRISDKKLVSFRSRKITRELTEEQRQIASERMKAIVERQKEARNTQS